MPATMHKHANSIEVFYAGIRGSIFYIGSLALNLSKGCPSAGSGRTTQTLKGIGSCHHILLRQSKRPWLESPISHRLALIEHQVLSLRMVINLSFLNGMLDVFRTPILRMVVHNNGSRYAGSKN